MTREEEILNAAREYNNGITFASSSNVLHFEAGAKWADENPVNVWHEPSEEPQNKPFRIICQDDWGNVEVVEDDVVKFVYQGDWEAYVKDNCIIRWAYISDLLPKGGEK